MIHIFTFFLGYKLTLVQMPLDITKRKPNLSVSLSIKTRGLEVLLFSEFINILPIFCIILLFVFT